MKPSPASSGFSLIEVTLALGIASFALVTVMGLLPVGLGTQQTSLEQTVATNIATSMVSDLEETPSASAIAANPALTAKSPRYGIDATQASTVLYLDDNGVMQSSAATARYKATVTLAPPGGAARSATCGTVLLSWPAAAPVAAGSVSFFVALDRN